MLAIVIPYFKRAFFEKTLESLANQTDQRFHVYIGNDASPEDCSDLIEKYRPLLSMTYVVFETNLGRDSLVHQWQRCLDLVTTASWVLLFGDDDVLGSDCVASFYAHLDAIQSHDCAVVRFPTVIIDAAGSPMSTVFSHPSLERGTAFLERKFFGLTRSSLGEYIFKKSILLEQGFYPFPLAWFSDDYAVLQCSSSGFIYTIPDAVVSIRESQLSISGSDLHLDQKNAATVAFCTLVLTDTRFVFSKKMRLKLLAPIERHFYEQHPKKMLVQLHFWYLFKTDIYQYFKFIRRLFRFYVLN